MTDTLPPVLTRRSADTAHARFALRIAAALSEFQSRSTHTDVDARLSFARDQALAAARRARGAMAGAAAVVGVTGVGAAVLGGGPELTPWWLRLGSLLPLAVLLAGLVLIDSHYTRSQINAAVEMDAAILTDALPPEAYRDQGFVEFLKTSRP